MQTATQPLFESMKFIPPTLDEVKERANTIGLPMREAEKFFLYYESNGWHSGRTKMQKWTMALAGWKLRWEERQPTKHLQEPNGKAILSGAQIVLYSKELERVQVKLDDINYSGSTCGWTPKLRDERVKFIRRKGELRKILGITV